MIRGATGVGLPDGTRAEQRRLSTESRRMSGQPTRLSGWKKARVPQMRLFPQVSRSLADKHPLPPGINLTFDPRTGNQSLVCSP